MSAIDETPPDIIIGHLETLAILFVTSKFGPTLVPSLFISV